MKKMMIVMLTTAIVTGASAMPAGHIGGGFHGGFAPRTTVIVGGGFYNPFYSPFGFYGYGYPYYPYAATPHQPTKLDMQITDIKNDYADKIASVKLDKTLTGKERRAKVREFKAERDQAVNDAKVNYYKS